MDFLEHELQAELNLTRSPCAGDLSVAHVLRATAGCAICGSASATRLDGLILSVIEGVVGFRPELHHRMVTPRKDKILQQRHIPVVAARTLQSVSPHGSEHAGLSIRPELGKI